MQSRIELARKVAWTAPALCIVALVSAALAIGVNHVEAWMTALTSTPVDKLICLGVVMAAVGYYLVLGVTGDPFWLVRKRLWTQRMFFVAVDDRKDLAEPFVWSKAKVPGGRDVSDLLN